jgi:iron complex outermembrane receptor protein
MTRNAVLFASILGLWTSFEAFPALPQSNQPPSESAQPESGTALAEIVVTAEKRTANLQTVPISVSAVSGATLQSANVQDMSDLEVAVPGISVVRQNTAVEFFIRGVGTDGAAAGQESAIATFVDGVYIPSLSGTTFQLNDVDRIEVLKGPQGTLYGRNATGGAVNVITKTPSQDTHVDFDIGYGNYQTTESHFYGTTGLTKNIAIDVTGAYSDQGQGFGRNVFTAGDANKTRDYAGRSKLYGDFDTTRITLAVDYADESGDSFTDYRALPSGHLLNGQVGWPYGFWDIQSNDALPDRIANSGASLRVEQDVGPLVFTSISAYRRLHEYQVVDYDTTPLQILEVPQNENDGQLTQEFQLASNKNEVFKWIAGVFYLRSYASYSPFEVTGEALAPATAQVIQDRQDTTSVAGYAQGTVEVVRGTHLTLGLRDTYDRRELRATDDLNFADGTLFPVVAPLQDRVSFNRPQWRIALDQQLTQDMMVYASYSRGVKSGVYNLTAPNNPPVSPETLDAYEIGLKSEFLDHRVRINAATFYYKYSDIQLTSLVNASQTLLNAATAEIFGAEAQIDAALTNHFSVHAGGQWLHDRYIQFPGVVVEVPGAFGDDQVSCTPQPEVCNGSGHRMIKTPDGTFNARADYSIPLPSGELALSAEYLWTDGFFWTADNRARQDAYSLVNAQAKYTFGDGRYNVRLWTSNLTNTKYYLSVAEAVTGDIGIAAPPRTYGIAAGVHF